MSQPLYPDDFPSASAGPVAQTEPFGTVHPNRDLPTSAGAGRTFFRTSVIDLDRPGNPAVFDEATRAEARRIIARYPEGQSRSALLPVLHLVQSVQGHVSPDGIAFCADVLGLTRAQVTAVASYYTMYKRHPTGEYLVSVCTNTLCGMLGGDEIFAALKEQLGVENSGGAPGSEGVAAGGQTTADGKITLEHAECLAACDYAPVVTVNYEFYDNQSVGSARNLVTQLQSGDEPQPTRGGRLCSFRQIERQLAGFYDTAEAFAPEAVSSGIPTEAGVKLAIERGDTAPSYASGDGGGAENEAAAGSAARTSQQPTSAHDAPLSTSEGKKDATPGRRKK